MNPVIVKDELTGALRREIFEQMFSDALEQAIREDTPLTLAVTDADHFLEINRDHGRQVGDIVLKTLVEILQKHAAPGTSVYPDQTVDEPLIFRYGGDEFFLIFPNTTREQALLKMEQARLEIAQSRSYGEATLQVDITAGIASYPIDGTESVELQRKADQALYRAKVTGRSQVLLAYDEKMIPKTTHFTETQLERLSALAEELSVSEARLLREALDDLIQKYRINKIEA